MAKKRRSKNNDNAIGGGCLALIALGVAVSGAVEFTRQNPIPAVLILFLIILVTIMLISRSRPRSIGGLTSVPVKNYENLPKLEKPAGYVYVIRDRKYRKYKIGRTVNPNSRLRDIQRNEVGILEYVYLMRTNDATHTERNLHERYAKFRIRKDREWFELGESQLQDLRNLISPKQNERGESSIWIAASASLLLSLFIVFGIISNLDEPPGSSSANQASLPRNTVTPRSTVTRKTPVPRSYVTRNAVARTDTATTSKTATATYTASSTPTITVAKPTMLYIRYFRDGSSGARVRSCPGITDCSVIAGLKSGNTILSPEKTLGEEVQGSNIWYRFSFNDSPGFVHCSTVTEEKQASYTVPAC